MTWRFGRTLAELRRDFRHDDAVAARLDRVEAAAGRWRTVGAEPEIAARRAGDAPRAEALVRTGRGKAAFDDVRREVASLQRLIDTRTLRAQHRERSDVGLLRFVVNASRLAIIVILVLGAFLMRRWVLAPVNRLRERMRRVAGGDLDQEVLVDGPEEVAAIARDAENMRRRIVAELDATRGATEALPQHSPVVSGAARRARRPHRPRWWAASRSPAPSSRPRGCSPATGGRRCTGPTAARRWCSPTCPGTAPRRAWSRSGSSSGSPPSSTPASTSARRSRWPPAAPTATTSGSCPASSWWSTRSPASCSGSTPATRPGW